MTSSVPSPGKFASLIPHCIDPRFSVDPFKANNFLFEKLIDYPKMSSTKSGNIRIRVFKADIYCFKDLVYVAYCDYVDLVPISISSAFVQSFILVSFADCEIFTVISYQGIGVHNCRFLAEYRILL